MNRNRSIKSDTVASLKQVFEAHSFAVVVHATGLNANDTLALRRKIREAGAGIRVSKNTLTRLALKGTPFEGLSQFLKGPTALAYAVEPVAVAKVLADFAKGNQGLKLVAANLDGNMLDAEATKRLATLPSLDVLRAQIVGMIQTPATRLACLMQAPAGQLARLMAAKGRGEGN